MRILKRPLLYFLFTLCIANDAIAKSCRLNGNWYTGNLMIAVFYGHGRQIVGLTTIFEARCGRRSLEGEITSSGLNFKLVQTPDSTGICAIPISWVGNFSEDCGAISGTMIAEGRPSEFIWTGGTYMKITEPSNEQDFVITAEPAMPEFKAAVTFGPNIPNQPLKPKPYKWGVNFTHVLGDTGRTLEDEFHEETRDRFYTPNFSILDRFRGGQLTLSVLYENSYYDEKEFVVKGTNPPKAWILAELNPIMQKIACVESRFRNFEARGDGGIGFPLIGINHKNLRVGGIGIMQIYYPPPKPDDPNTEQLPPKAIWNWRENILHGRIVFDKKQSESKLLHLNEHKRLNKERAKKGLPLCPQGIPTPLTVEQVERDTIRRYNCGVEYRWEPRDAEDCKGEWKIDPSCIRKNTEGHDPVYVEKVLNCKIN